LLGPAGVTLAPTYGVRKGAIHPITFDHLVGQQFIELALPARPIEAGDKTTLDRVATGPKDDRNLCGRRLGGNRGAAPVSAGIDYTGVTEQCFLDSVFSKSGRSAMSASDAAQSEQAMGTTILRFCLGIERKQTKVGFCITLERPLIFSVDTLKRRHPRGGP
jgi:hypothetical protein